MFETKLFHFEPFSSNLKIFVFVFCWYSNAVFVKWGKISVNFNLLTISFHDHFYYDQKLSGPTLYILQWIAPLIASLLYDRIRHDLKISYLNHISGRCFIKMKDRMWVFPTLCKLSVQVEAILSGPTVFKLLDRHQKCFNCSCCCCILIFYKSKTKKKKIVLNRLTFCNYFCWKLDVSGRLLLSALEVLVYSESTIFIGRHTYSILNF